MVESVLELDRLPVRDIMTPRPKIIWLNRDDLHDTVWHKIERLETLLPGIDFGSKADKDYQTLAGFAVKHLGHVPQEGEVFETQGYVFEVLDMDRHRIDKMLVLPSKPHGAAGPAAP